MSLARLWLFRVLNFICLCRRPNGNGPNVPSTKPVVVSLAILFYSIMCMHVEYHLWSSLWYICHRIFLCPFQSAKHSSTHPNIYYFESLSVEIGASILSFSRSLYHFHFLNTLTLFVSFSH